jgi:hypothetical protein
MFGLPYSALTVPAANNSAAQPALGGAQPGSNATSMQGGAAGEAAGCKGALMHTSKDVHVYSFNGKLQIRIEALCPSSMRMYVTDAHGNEIVPMPRALAVRTDPDGREVTPVASASYVLVSTNDYVVSVDGKDVVTLARASLHHFTAAPGVTYSRVAY